MPPSQSERSRIQFQHETLPSLSYFPMSTRTIREHDQNETINRQRETRSSEFLSDVKLLHENTQSLILQRNRVDNENYNSWNCFRMKLLEVRFGLAWSRTQTFSALFSQPQQPPSPRPHDNSLLSPRPQINLRDLSASSTKCPTSTPPNHGLPNQPSSSKPALQRFVTSLFPFTTFLAHLTPTTDTHIFKIHYRVPSILAQSAQEASIKILKRAY